MRLDRSILLAAATLVADLVTKSVVFANVPEGEEEKLLAGVAIAPTRNEGIAFSMLEGQTLLIFLLMTAAIVLLVVYYLRNRDQAGLWIATGLMLGGALGNAIDRVRLGYVRDFIEIGSWPTFNLADVALSAGVVVLLVTQWRAAGDASHEVESELESDEPENRDIA